ncbi:MAG: DUF4367 domain-containing protein [Firmicutes bacterium]|nr:DUF4367 domain-containing protein [Bacillota bacterium]
MDESTAFEKMIKASLREKARHVQLSEGIKNHIMNNIPQEGQKNINREHNNNYGKEMNILKRLRYSLGYKKMTAAVLGLTLLFTVAASEQARVWAMDSIEKAWIVIKGENGQYSLTQVPENEAPGYDKNVKSVFSIGAKSVTEDSLSLEFEEKLGIAIPNKLPGGWILDGTQLTQADGVNDIEKLLGANYKKDNHRIFVSMTSDEWWKNTHFQFTEENKVKDVKIGNNQGAWYKLGSPRYGIIDNSNTKDPIGISIVQGLCWKDEGVYYFIYEHYDEQSVGSFTIEQAVKMAESM